MQALDVLSQSINKTLIASTRLEDPNLFLWFSIIFHIKYEELFTKLMLEN